MLPPTQIIRTSPTAFALTVWCAFGMAVWLIVTAIDDATTIGEALIALLPAMIGACFVAIFGAAAGGLLALLCGARLSRQYCWVFGTSAGFLTMYGGSFVSMRTLAAIPGTRTWGFGGSSTGLLLPLLLMLFTIASGVTWGVMMTLRRLGFARRSRRAALIGTAGGAVAIAILFAIWTILERVASASGNVSFSGFNSGWLTATLILGFSVLGGVVGALLYAERYEAPRFAVLPLDAASIPAFQSPILNQDAS